MKKILKNKVVVSIVTRLAAAYIWLVHKTVRWQEVNGELPNQFMKDGKPFVMAFWHGRLFLMAPLVPPNVKTTVMISQHGDGELIAKVVQCFGVKSIRGSTSKGGVPALKDMLRVLKRNEIAVITPDGPRGPRMHAQDGVVGLAAMARVPVLPVSFSTTRTKHLSSWDSFALAKPFGRGVVVWGDPVNVPRKDIDGSFERARIQIQEELTFVTQESDRLCGLVPVKPATSTQTKESTVK